MGLFGGTRKQTAEGLEDASMYLPSAKCYYFPANYTGGRQTVTLTWRRLRCRQRGHGALQSRNL